uniref:DNA mismatch repair protein putative n=1 Tax=Albugo laibachii Nc14 TaxID=890382 RepID=F0WA36_9STRA|nr:DNA mismatch repair protein putative [Albugo laibachii Nc14]|eukprot:CCA18006.1 DNA mismatch repair protein putative [Albugo laibachii Nc14]
MEHFVMRRIKRLSAQVVNRIAAGEVIHRPENAVKELLENSIDAGATNISITISQGGLKLIQIQDNGKGILRDDLEIVCERFTTSKLQKFEDLCWIQSFGFRGEALASISHVAHVTITSKPAAQECAYRAKYRDGKPIATCPGSNPDPAPCAGKDGTLIVIEDLFYNLSTRRQALKNAAEQYQRILDIVQKYAIHFASKKIGFVCRKHQGMNCSLNTVQAASLGKTRQVVQSIFGTKVACELLSFQHTVVMDGITTATLEPCRVEGLISHANFSLKRGHIFFFINHRLVSCGALKRACEYMYSIHIPKQCHPFLYLSLIMPSQNIDVNVHPTKQEVHFLYEEEIVESIVKALEKEIKKNDQSRTFLLQPIRNLMSQDETKASEDLSTKSEKTKGSTCTPTPDTNGDESSQKSWISIDLSAKQVPHSRKYDALKTPNRLVRTDPRTISIEKYRVTSSQKTLSSSIPSSCKKQRLETPLKTPDAISARLDFDEFEDDAEPESETKIESQGSSIGAPTQNRTMPTSVQNLIQQIQAKRNAQLVKLFREHTFVGVVDHRLSLLQHRTKLYIVQHQKIASSYLYEQLLSRFGQLEAFQIAPALPVYELLYEALCNPRVGYDEEDGPQDQLAEEMKAVLVSQGRMLAEYFSIDIDSNGMLHHLPVILPHHLPSLHSLPEFLFRLATDVNWEEEEQCVSNIAEIVAKWYGELRYPEEANEKHSMNKEKALERVNGMGKTSDMLEHVIFPAMKVKSTAFTPPYDLNKDDIVRPIACLTKLYKVFERC